MKKLNFTNINPYAGLGCALLASEIDTVDSTGPADMISVNEMSITIGLEKNRDYKISFWYKLSGVGYMMNPFNFYYYQNNQEKIFTTIFNYNWNGEYIPGTASKILDDTGWLYFSEVFTSDSESNAVFHITTQVENVWIDNLKIKITE